MENLTKMKHACTSRFGNIGQRQLLGFMLVDVLARLQNEWRLRVSFLHHQLITERGKLLGKKCEQPHDRVVFVRRDKRISLPRFADFSFELNSTALQLAADFGRVRLDRHMAQHLPDSQVSDGLSAEFHRHRRLG